MIVCPNAKINLGLEVVRRRDDGYHDIETLFVPVPGLRDVLEVVKADKPALKVYGMACDVPAEKNLCFKAFRLMQKRCCISNVNIFLYKNIPMGAGLGGGSADAAFTLVALNEVFEVGLSDEQLAGMAAELGSDCPFFVYNRPMFASGRGEILEPYPLDLSGYHIEVVTPGIHISTAEAYAGVDAIKVAGKEGAGFEQGLPRLDKAKKNLGAHYANRAGVKEVDTLRDKLSLGINTWRENVVNEFEAYAFAKYPTLADIKNSLYERGAVYASMTGSGSSVYGIFPK